MGPINRYLKKSLYGLIRCYQLFISPCFKPCCRFYPSCSQYALNALSQWGIVPGLWMGFKRILRCNPWSMGGYDPVLPKEENQ